MLIEDRIQSSVLGTITIIATVEGVEKIYEFPNTICVGLKESLSSYIAGDNTGYITNFKIGTGSTIPTPSDSDIETFLFGAPITSVTKISSNKIQFRLDVEQADAVTIPVSYVSEMSLHTASGIITSRSLLEIPLPKTPTTRLTIFWTYEFKD